MSFRRFLYLVADDLVDRGSGYSLRRIDMSRFFFRHSTEGVPTPLESGGAGATDPSAMEDAGRLPDPALSVCTPKLRGYASALVDFLLFKNKGRDGENPKVVTIDHKGHTLMCDLSQLPPNIQPLPGLPSPKFIPFSLTVGGSLYVMDAFPEQPNRDRRRHSFQVLSQGHGRSSHLEVDTEWYWQPLPPPPYVNGFSDPSHYIESYAVVAGTDILVSNRGAHTYRFDTVKSTWTMAGDWPLPFSCLAEYVPEHRLWFGLSPSGDGCRFLAANLMVPSDSGEMMSPPVVYDCWLEYLQPPPEWSLARSYAVHLGSSKFCIVRFFEIGKLSPDTKQTYKTGEDYQVVLTGVEVESSGEELRVVKHKSERYNVTGDSRYWLI